MYSLMAGLLNIIANINILKSLNITCIIWKSHNWFSSKRSMYILHKSKQAHWRYYVMNEKKKGKCPITPSIEIIKCFKWIKIPNITYTRTRNCVSIKNSMMISLIKRGQLILWLTHYKMFYTLDYGFLFNYLKTMLSSPRVKLIYTVLYEMIVYTFFRNKYRT